MRRVHIVGQIALRRKHAYVRIITRFDEGIITQDSFARMSQEGIEHVEILCFSNKLRQGQRLRKIVVVKRPAGLGWRPVEGVEYRRHLEKQRFGVSVLVTIGRSRMHEKSVRPRLTWLGGEPCIAGRDL